MALLVSALSMPATNALQSMERPQAIVWAGSVGAVLTIVLVWCLMIKWGLLGAAFGFLAGYVAGTVGRWVAFLLLVPRSGPQPEPETDPKVQGEDRIEPLERRSLGPTDARAPAKQWLAGSS
jgi:hypothetical protein